MRFFAMLILWAACAMPAMATLPIFDPGEAEAEVALCTFLNEDPAASFELKVSGSTVYNGDSLASFLVETSSRLDDHANLTLVHNTAARNVMMAFHACLISKEGEMVHGVTVWANRTGGMNIYEADLTDDSKNYDFNEYTKNLVHDNDGSSEVIERPTLKMRDRALSATVNCDGKTFVGEFVFGDQPVFAYSKRPAKTTDPDFSLHGCRGQPCSSCMLMWETKPVRPGSSVYESFYSCMCRGGYGTKCNHSGPSISYPPSPFIDMNGNGEGDGGLW